LHPVSVQVTVAEQLLLPAQFPAVALKLILSPLEPIWLPAENPVAGEIGNTVAVVQPAMALPGTPQLQAIV
jgi:hypothetical protein